MKSETYVGKTSCSDLVQECGGAVRCTEGRLVAFRVSRIDASPNVYCVSVCLSVHRRIPALRHGPGRNLGEMVEGAL